MERITSAGTLPLTRPETRPFSQQMPVEALFVYW